VPFHQKPIRNLETGKRPIVPLKAKGTPKGKRAKTGKG